MIEKRYFYKLAKYIPEKWRLITIKMNFLFFGRMFRNKRIKRSESSLSRVKEVMGSNLSPNHVMTKDLKNSIDATVKVVLFPWPKTGDLYVKLKKCVIFLMFF